MGTIPQDLGMNQPKGGGCIGDCQRVLVQSERYHSASDSVVTVDRVTL